MEERLLVFSLERITLDFLIILYSEIFVMSNGFLNFFRKKFCLSSKKTEKKMDSPLDSSLTAPFDRLFEGVRLRQFGYGLPSGGRVQPDRGAVKSF